jgi:hypothetical protein
LGRAYAPLRLGSARTEGFLKAATALLNAGANPNTGFFEEKRISQ